MFEIGKQKRMETIGDLPRGEELRLKRQRMLELADLCTLISDNSLTRDQRSKIQELQGRMDFKHAELQLDFEIAYTEARIDIMQQVLDTAKNKV